MYLWQRRHWGPSQQWEGGRRTAWTGHQDTHTHPSCLTHSHPPKSPMGLSLGCWRKPESFTQKGRHAGIAPETLGHWQHQSLTFTTNTGVHKSVFCKHTAATVSHPGSRCPCCCSTLPAINSKVERRTLPSHLCAHKHTIAGTGFSAQLQPGWEYCGFGMNAGEALGEDELGASFPARRGNSSLSGRRQRCYSSYHSRKHLYTVVIAGGLARLS